ncbi:Ldh family oxidoreductase, partial [Paracoccaceae bacterium]|nr:Ldh family oxidoreductase [Paracoccaceae bacterium]
MYDLAFNVLTKFGCNKENANSISTTVSSAERDGSLSHGLFRVPGYVASLKSGKVNGKAEPKITSSLPSVITVDGNLGYAPYSLEKSLPVLSGAALKYGIAVMRLINSFHFAALWPE